MGAKCFGCYLLSKIILATVATVATVSATIARPVPVVAAITTVTTVTAPTAVTSPSHWVSFWYNVYTETKQTF